MANLHTATALAREQGLALLDKYPKALLIEKDFNFKRPKEQKKEPHGIQVLQKHMKEAEEKKKQRTTDTIALKKLVSMSSSVNVSRKHNLSIPKVGVEQSVTLDASML